MRGHERAWESAEAAEWARDQGFFWKMHDLLMEAPPNPTVDELAAYARQLGGDPASLREALASKKYRPRIIASQAEARVGGLTGTPTLFVNGRRWVVPDYSEESLEQLLEEEEEWMQGGGRWAKHE